MDEFVGRKTEKRERKKKSWQWGCERKLNGWMSFSKEMERSHGQQKSCVGRGDVTQKPDRLDNTAVFFVNDGLVGGNMSEDDNKHDENEISGIFSHILPFDKNKYRKKTLK